jgi:Tfp pilus assembly protein PilE
MEAQIFRPGRKIKGLIVIEMLTVLLVISVLATIIVMDLRRAYYRGKLVGCVSNLRNLATAQNQFIVENRKYPDTLAELTPRYIASIPTCPSARADTYSTGYVRVEDPDRFTLHCKGTNHDDKRLGADEPWYNFDVGVGPHN